MKVVLKTYSDWVKAVNCERKLATGSIKSGLLIFFSIWLPRRGSVVRRRRRFQSESTSYASVLLDCDCKVSATSLRGLKCSCSLFRVGVFGAGISSS